MTGDVDQLAILKSTSLNVGLVHQQNPSTVPDSAITVVQSVDGRMYRWTSDGHKNETALLYFPLWKRVYGEFGLT